MCGSESCFWWHLENCIICSEYKICYALVTLHFFMGELRWGPLKDWACSIDNVRAEWHKKVRARAAFPQKNGIFWDCKFKTGNNLRGRKGISGVCWCAFFSPPPLSLTPLFTLFLLRFYYGMEPFKLFNICTRWIRHKNDTAGLSR